jgi:glycosyltransferase involved in cell wall biosynthesis
MKSPTVSVIMGIYKEPEEWIRTSINSILDQTFSDFEFIIINDKPDRIENERLLEEYRQKDSRIIALSNEQNLGLIQTLNKGLKIAKGKYFARMDADDISLPARFEKQVEVMEQNPHIIVCGSKFEKFGSDRDYRFIFPEKSEDIKELLVKQCCIAHPTTMIRKSALTEKNLLYDESAIHAEDYKLWSDLYDSGDFYNIQETLLKYRVSDTQVSSGDSGKQQQLHSAHCRREIIDKILRQKGYQGQIDWDNITTSILKEIKPYNVPNIIKEVIYLSLKRYGLQTLFYLVFSLDYLHFSLKTNLAIISRFFLSRSKLL